METAYAAGFLYWPHGAGRQPGLHHAQLPEDGETMIVVHPKGRGKGPIVVKRGTDGG